MMANETAIQVSGEEHDQVVTMARKRLEENAVFRGRSKTIQIREKDGCLLLEGAVPSFYLKQMLQTMLRGIDGVREIQNRVNVVSASGAPN